MTTTTRFFAPLLCLSAAAAARLVAQECCPVPAAPIASIATPSSPAAEVRPMLGVVTERVSDEIRHQFPQLKPGAGLMVRRVVPDSPAAMAQVECLDILLQWNDQTLVHPAQLQALVTSAKPGDQVALEFLHRGTLTKAQVTLAAPLQSHHQGHQPPAAVPARNPLLNPDLAMQAIEALGQAGITPDTIGAALEGLKLEDLDTGAITEALKGIDTDAIMKTLEGLKIEDLDTGAITEALKGIDADAIMKSLGGLKLEDLDPKVIGEGLKGIDLNAIMKALEGLSPAAPAAPAPAPAPEIPAKVIIIGADGTRTEIPVGKALEPGGNPAELLGRFDLSKLDPAVLLSGRILLVRPDGTEQEVSKADLLKNSDVINQLLKGLTKPE